MSKKTITLTEKDATEIADTILNNVSVEVEVDVDDQELRDKWENTEVFGVIENFIDGLDYPVDHTDIELAYKYETNILKKELVGMEVEIEEVAEEVVEEESLSKATKLLNRWNEVDSIGLLKAIGEYTDEDIESVEKLVKETYHFTMEEAGYYLIRDNNGCEEWGKRLEKFQVA